MDFRVQFDDIHGNLREGCNGCWRMWSGTVEETKEQGGNHRLDKGPLLCHIHVPIQVIAPELQR